MNEIVNDDETLNNELLADVHEQTAPTAQSNSKQNQNISNLPVFSFEKNGPCDDILAQHLKLQVYNTFYCSNLNTQS